MVNEIINFLNIQPGETGFDATLGYGGHTKAMLQQLQGKGHMYATDVDPIESAKTKKRLADAGFGEDILTIKLQNFCTIDEIAKWAEENRLHMVHLFTVNDLNHLYRGGRISRTTAVVGSMLNIKPVLHVDNDGKLTAIGKVRGRKKSLQELVKLMDEKIGSYHDTCHTIFISHGDCEEDANYVAEKVKEKYQINTIIMNQVGATIGAHSGPGTMALFFVGDER